MGIIGIGCVAGDIEQIRFNAQNNGSNTSNINKSDVPEPNYDVDASAPDISV